MHTPGFAEEYGELVATLYRRLQPADGVAETVIADTEARLGFALPPPLRTAYRLSGAFTSLHHACHRLIPADALRVEHDGLAFYQEIRGALSWGIRAADLTACDPPVCQAPAGAPAEWRAEHPRLSGFLLTMVYVQALEAGLGYGAATEITAEVERLVAGWWPMVSETGGPVSGTRIYAVGTEVIRIRYNPEELQLQAGAKTRNALTEIRMRLGIRWRES